MDEEPHAVEATPALRIHHRRARALNMPPSHGASLEDRFHMAMLHLYYACAARLKPPYFASRFLELVLEHGGKHAADRLLASPALAPVFAELSLRGSEHLTFSVEYLALQAPWRALFTDEQRAIARGRLLQAGATLPPDDAPGIEA